MRLLTLLLVLATATCLTYAWWDRSSEEDRAERACSSSCPNEAAVRQCCQSQGFATGYCKPFRNAECEGRRFLRRIRQEPAQPKPSTTNRTG